LSGYLRVFWCMRFDWLSIHSRRSPIYAIHLILRILRIAFPFFFFVLCG
jgi:hypothetical protein